MRNKTMKKNLFIIILAFIFSTFTHISAMPKHTKTTDSNEYACYYTGCNKSYKRSSSLEKHIRAIHKGLRYVCNHPGCTSSYTSQQGLCDHIDVIHNNIIHKCPYEGCNNEYPYTQSLNLHIKTKHEGISYDCTYEGCNKSFKKSWQLERHIGYIHNHTLASTSTSTSNNNDEQTSNEELSPAMLLEEFNKALDADNIELAQQLIESTPIDIINQIKTQLLYSIIIKNKTWLIDIITNKN